MQDNYIPCLYILLDIEGGYNNDPLDPGGITNLGITKRAWQKYKGRAVSIQEMKDLKFKDAKPFYNHEYWGPIWGDDLFSGIDLCVFDAAVLSGPEQAIKWLQRCLGCEDDGVIGPETMRYHSHCHPWDVINDYCDMRLKFLRTLDNWDHNKNGWKKRIDTVRKKSEGLINAKV